MNLKEIKDMIKLMNENGLVELEVEKEGTRIKLKRASSELSEPFHVHPAEYHLEPPSLTPKIPTQNSGSSSPAVAKDVKVISSPMVGTFYRAPSPESPSFVDVGQVVEIGQVVCIVEAMKLMNEIKSESRGKIVQVAVENAEPVEFGQTLFVLEPA